MACLAEGEFGGRADATEAAYWHIRAAAHYSNLSILAVERLRASPEGGAALERAAARMRQRGEEAFLEGLTRKPAPRSRPPPSRGAAAAPAPALLR